MLKLFRSREDAPEDIHLKEKPQGSTPPASVAFSPGDHGEDLELCDTQQCDGLANSAVLNNLNT